MQNLETAVTIDILNESDRFSSRQSLEPLTNRDSTASRISSVGFFLFPQLILLRNLKSS